MSKDSASKYYGPMTLRELLDNTIASWKRERPDLDLAAMGSVLRVNQFMNAALRGAEALFAPHGITAGEFDVLAALRRGGAGTVLTPTALARVAMISPAGMTNRLNRLEAAGLIVRRPDPDDRRGSHRGAHPERTRGRRPCRRGSRRRRERALRRARARPNGNASTASSTSSSTGSTGHQLMQACLSRQGPEHRGGTP